MNSLIDSTKMGLMTSHRITANKKNLDTSMNNLSTGVRINKAADDVAGCAISTRLSAEIRSHYQAKRNAEQAISLIQVSEGYLQTIQNDITRMKELSLQAASDSYGPKDRGFLNIEFKKLNDEVEHIISSAKYGSIHVLNGSMGEMEFQIGVFGNEDNIMKLTLDEYTVDPEKIICTTDISTKEGAQNCIEELADTLDYISRIRANIGALQNRLTSIIVNIDNTISSKSSANSKIMDTDIAQETSTNLKNKLLLESSTAMMAQANQGIAKASQLLT